MHRNLLPVTTVYVWAWRIKTTYFEKCLIYHKLSKEFVQGFGHWGGCHTMSFPSTVFILSFWRLGAQAKCSPELLSLQITELLWESHILPSVFMDLLFHGTFSISFLSSMAICQMCICQGKQLENGWLQRDKGHIVLKPRSSYSKYCTVF